MLLDKLLLKNLDTIGKSISRKSGLTSYPKNIDEINSFLVQVKDEINSEELDGLLMCAFTRQISSNLKALELKHT